MSVLIAVPTYETIATECYKALWEQEACGHDVMFEAVKGYDCALARITSCKKALEYGVEWVWMVDSDTVPPPDALSKLLEHDADVVLGYYQWKNRERGRTCVAKNGGWSRWHTGDELRALAGAGVTLVEVQGGGLGCALVRTSVFGKLPQPWFRWVVRPDGTETGEDIYFCDMLRGAGVPIFADTRVACGYAYREVHEL